MHNFIATIEFLCETLIFGAIVAPAFLYLQRRTRLKHKTSTQEVVRIGAELAVLRDALDSVPAPVLIADSNFIVRAANKRFVDLFVDSPFGVEGRHMREVLSAKLFEQLTSRSSASETVLKAECRDKDARSFRLQITHRQHDGDDVSLYYLAPFDSSNDRTTIQDQSEILGIQKYLSEVEQARVRIAEQAQQLEVQSKELEAARDEALKATKAKSMFLATMSHELRTPMNGIMGMIQLLTHEPLSVRQREYVDSILSAGRDLVDIVNDILDSSKMESGKFQLAPGPFDIRRLSQDVTRLLNTQAESKKVSLISYIDERVFPHVIVDGTRLRQVLINLIGNATKFTQAEGAVVFAIHYVEATATNQILEISVSDTGIGIAEDKLAKIFAPFDQADNTIARDFGGTGLGLSISQRIVELMGSRIQLRSKVGVGSVFYFRLTLPKATAEQQQASQSSAAPAVRFKILVVDDSEANRRVAMKMLTSIGYDCIVVEDGVSAVSAVSNQVFDLIIMDCDMPEVDGYEATRRIRSNKGTVVIPIIGLTSDATESGRQRCLDVGMNEVVFKPVKKNELQNKITVFAQKARS